MATASFGEQLMRALPFGYLGIVSRGFWLVRELLAVTARPVKNLFRTTTTVVVPSFDEDPDVLLRCLRTGVRHGPSRITIRTVSWRDARSRRSASSPSPSWSREDTSC